MLRFIAIETSRRDVSTNERNNDSGQVFRQVQDTEHSRSAGMTKIQYQNKSISFNKWEKFTVAEAFEKFTQISEKELFNQKLLMRRAEEKVKKK